MKAFLFAFLKVLLFSIIGLVLGFAMGAFFVFLFYSDSGSAGMLLALFGGMIGGGIGFVVRILKEVQKWRIEQAKK